MKDIYKKAFGKNDIRGIYGDDITEELFYNTGRGLGSYLHKVSNKKPEEMYLTVCMDARTHSPVLSKALQAGITSVNAHVIDLGLAPTPIGYYSEVTGTDSCGHDVISACIITASHNPKEYNGLKMTYNGQTLTESQIKEVRDITLSQWTDNLSEINNNLVKTENIIPYYIEDMLSRFKDTCSGVKVVVDSANATGGIVGPELYRKLGCDVIELYSEPDGNFPNHHPNPSVEKTLDKLKEVVVENNADLGIAYDGDSDRIGVIDNLGNYLTGDKLLLIYAQDIIEHYKAKGVVPDIVSEVKCSQVLFDTINNIGGKAHMCKTGHGFIKTMMSETGAILAGEMSGHTFFKDRYYGFDDAIYAGCRIIEIIAKHKNSDKNFTVKDMLKPFDEVYTSPEVRYSCPNEFKKETLEKIKDNVSNNRRVFGSEIKDIITLDGMRIVFDGGFALIRQSNTEPVFTLRFEAKTKDECERFKAVMCNLLDDILSSKVG